MTKKNHGQENEDVATSFKPVFFAPGAHLQTILGALVENVPADTQQRIVPVRLGDGDKLIVHEDLGRDTHEKTHGSVVLLHGLGGDSESTYMLRASLRFRQHGFRVFRCNQRGAGAGAGYAKRLYNAGRGQDLGAALNAVDELIDSGPMIVIGYSMSGNTVLKYLSENANATPASLRGAIVVNPAADLTDSMARLEKPSNWLYHRRFTRLLNSQHRENLTKANLKPPSSRHKSVRAFDDAVTAPAWGFADAADYYEKCSAKNQMHKITLDTTILTSRDDPMVDFRTFTAEVLSTSTKVLLVPAGGHMGYLSAAKTPWGDRHWMDFQLVTVASQL